MTTCYPAYLPTLSLKPSRLLSITAIAVLGASCTDAPMGPSADGDAAGARGGRHAVSLEVGAPGDGAVLSGAVVFSAGLSDGRPASDYVMHWQVDNGTPVLLADAAPGEPGKTGAADVSGWTWNGTGPYVLTFSARERKNNKLIAQRSVQVHVAAPAPPPAGGASLLDSGRLWVNPDSRAKQQADAWRASRPADAAQLDKIAGQPAAQWFGDWHVDIRTAVAQLTLTITAAGALPVYVAYNIPVRDCNSYSGGGAPDASAYRHWIREFAAGLGDARAVVILEPDALAGLSCLTTAQRDERYALLADAVSVLRAQGSAVYIDAGHSRWIGAAEMAARLERANIAHADGFALNVSNFQTTDSNVAYGIAVSTRLSVRGRQFVIDTSRNGLGPTADNQWCNPDGRALGTAPGTVTADPLVAAYLWIKKPGESDGTCNGGPTAGAWWADYALGLATRAPVMVAYGG